MISESKNDSNMVAQSSLDVFECRVGDRIECNGDLGTIKYIGPVEGHPGTWLGVDWDNPIRGKHNGTVNGIEYFKASHPKSGSFVRKEKANFGRTLIDAVVSKYTNREDEMMVKKREQELLQFQQMMKAPFIQLVGFDKVKNQQSHLDKLNIVNVRSTNVSSVGNPDELKHMLSSVKELDVSKNLFSSWRDICEICRQLENLYLLNISENVLKFPDNLDDRFPNVKVLICTSMNLTWHDVIKISKIFPNVEDLRVPNNNITNLDTPEDTFRNLRLLDLSGNPIKHWSEINKLGKLKNLQYLALENVGIENIYFESKMFPIDEFQNLSVLYISENKIDNWRSISELNKLKNLKELRFAKNPILETVNLATKQQMIIAKIASLQILNGRRIDDEERRGAEYDYIRKYGLEWLKVKNTEERDRFLEEHNRYLELIEKYGELEESELVVKANNLKGSLITLNIVFNDKTVIKKLPPSMLVQKLVMLIQKTFKISDRPTLTYISADSNLEISLEDEMKEIGYYSLKDDDTILVHT